MDGQIQIGLGYILHWFSSALLCQKYWLIIWSLPKFIFDFVHYTLHFTRQMIGVFYLFPTKRKWILWFA